MQTEERNRCTKQIHLKLSEEDLKRIRDRMEQGGFLNMSAYIRRMAINGYFIQVDFHELLEVLRLLKIDSNNINQIAKIANTHGTIDAKTIADMIAEHAKVLRMIRQYFDKLLE